MFMCIVYRRRLVGENSQFLVRIKVIKICVSWKIMSSKQIFVSKNVWVQKSFYSKKVLVQNRYDIKKIDFSIARANNQPSKCSWVLTSNITDMASFVCIDYKVPHKKRIQREFCKPSRRHCSLKSGWSFDNDSWHVWAGLQSK